MSLAVIKMEECDVNKGGKVVGSQTERKYTVEEMGDQIENKHV